MIKINVALYFFFKQEQKLSILMKTIFLKDLLK